MTLQDLQTPKTVSLSDSTKHVESEKIIDSITKGLSKPYFNKILKELLKRNFDNARIMCDYIIAQQTEINIKDSTKEGKIKILVWLSMIFKTKNLIEI